MATKLTTDVAIPPGELLAEELAARGMTQRELARKMGRSEQVISEIVNAKKAITAETALQLEEALGISPEIWLNLEAMYRLTLARRARGATRPAERRRRAAVR